MDDYNCVVSAGCNFNECVQYFSLDNGDDVQSCITYGSILCASGSCANGVCVDAPQNTSTLQSIATQALTVLQ
jgi:hypothetical protein